MAALSVATTAYHTFLSLFSYNKANFLYDRNQRVNRVFTGISYKLQEFGLYRQDIRDLTGLTTNTTTQYHLVTVLELGMCVTLLGPARLPEDVPEWVLWHQLVALVNAFMLLATSMWLATRAAITAESLNVRLQTQYVRLPFPDGRTLDSALTKAEEFEGASLKDMVRVPFMKATTERVLGRPMEFMESDAEGKKKKKQKSHRKAPGLRSLPFREPGVEGPRPLVSESHLLLYRQLQKHWQGFDAYARVTMSTGTYWLILSLAYYKIGWTLCHQRAGLVAGGTAALFASVVVLLAYVDLHIDRLELGLTACLVYAGPVFVQIGAARSVPVDQVIIATVWEAVGAGVAHALLTLWMWHLGRTVPGDVELPTRFLGVQYLDIFSPMIHEIRRHLGHAPVHSALSRMSHSRANLRNRIRHYTGLGSALHSSDTTRSEVACTRLAAAVADNRNVAKRVQHLGNAVWAASEAGVTLENPEMQEAQCLLKRLEMVVALRSMRRTLRNRIDSTAQHWLGTGQAEQLQGLVEDVELRISQLESCTGRSGLSIHSSASEADTEGAREAIPRNPTLLSSKPCSEIKDMLHHTSDDRSASRPTEGFGAVAQGCEELLARADGLIFNAGSILKSESAVSNGPSLSRQSSKVSLDSLISEYSSKSSISHLANLVQHATEPLHRRHNENNFYRTLAMDMPKNMYNVLCGVMLLIWCTGAVVHFTRLEGLGATWHVRPGRLLQKVEPGVFLGKRLSNRADAGERSLPVSWPDPFFRPSGLHCMEEESIGQGAQFMVSNNYLVYKIALGQGNSPRAFKCPVPRHDSIVSAQCMEGGSCTAVVAAQGALYKCFASDSGTESSQVAKPFAVLPPEWLQGAGGMTLQAWAAADSNITRIFAAPGQGPIIELRRIGNTLQPVAELPVPRSSTAITSWKSLSVQGDVLLAITNGAPTAYAWSLATGEELGSWRLPALPPTVWCGSGGSPAQELLGLATTRSAPNTAVFVSVPIPSRLSVW